MFHLPFAVLDIAYDDLLTTLKLATAALSTISVALVWAFAARLAFAGAPLLSAVTMVVIPTYSSRLSLALLHGPEQIADLPVPVAESPGAVRIGHPERSHLVEYLAPNSVFNSLPRQRSCPHLGPDDRFVTIDRVLHHASLGAA